MEKRPFVTKAQVEEIVKTHPTPFHLYDEKGIRENARRLKQAFAWNKGFKEYFAVKATPNPFIMQVLKADPLFRGARRVLVSASLTAHEFYAKLGYREAGIVPCTFNGIEGIDLVMLEKSI